MTKKHSFKRITIVLVVAAIALIALRVALPGLVKNYLNQQLAEMGDYQGRIADVDIALFRGAYVIRGMEIVKISEAVPVPFFEADDIDLSVSWRALLTGRVVAEVEFIHPELHFVDGDGKDSQSEHVNLI